MMNTLFETPFGDFHLQRADGERNQSLQAWSSADSYLLKQFSESNNSLIKNILVINDAFGALTVSLSQDYNVFSFSDSFCTSQLIMKNLERNQVQPDRVSLFHELDKMPESIDLILLKNPKSLNYLQFILQSLNAHCESGIPLVAADMTKNVHTSTVKLFEEYLDHVSTSLAWKKSRLIMGKTGQKDVKEQTFPISYTPADELFSLVNYPNLFAYGRLDPGSAFMISNFPKRKEIPSNIIDVASGDGILALKAASLWPEASILCTDESYLAVKSARESADQSGFSNAFDFLVTDGLRGVEEDSTDLILCNPPFHDNHSLSTTTALNIFHQSYEVLKEDGELWIIANRHLGYEKSLKKKFRKVSVHKSNKKFSIIRCLK